MISVKVKTFCLMAIAVSVVGCSGSGSDSESGELVDPQIVLDDVVTVDVATPDEVVVDDATTIEVTDNTVVTDSIATPVQPVSSAQMDRYILNPLLAAIPAELSSGSSIAITSKFTANPLMH